MIVSVEMIGRNVEQDGDLGPIDPTAIPDNEIWYRTTDGEIYNINCYTEIPFDVNVISNTYQNGIGVIKCDGAIKYIDALVFRGYNATANNITELFVKEIEDLCKKNLQVKKKKVK